MSVDGARARILFDAGVTNVSSLAAAKTADIENILHTNTAFVADNHGEVKKTVKNIFVAGLPPMTESQCAKLMVEGKDSDWSRQILLLSDWLTRDILTLLQRPELS